MNSSSSLDDVWYTHEEAITFYSKGMYEKAAEIFAKNFELIHTSIQNDTSSFGQEMNSNRPSTSSTSPFYIQIERQDEHLVFHLPLHVCDICAAEQFAFTSMYNLALSQHMAALTTTKSPHLINKAVMTWELVHSLQWREELNLQPVHTLAILSNLGHAYLLAGMDEKGNHCYETILGVLHIIRENKEKVDFSSFFIKTAQTALTPEAAAAA